MARPLFSIFGGGVALALIVYTRAEDATRPPTTEPITVTTPLQGLDYWRDVKFPTVRFNGTPLEEALEKFRDATHANLVVDWPAIEASGLHRTTPIRLRLYNVSALKALELILAEAHEPDNFTRIESRADDEGVLHITTAPDRGAIMRMYDVRDLIARLFDPQGKDSDEVFRDPQAVTTRSDMLIRIIMDTIDPDSWRDNGGAVGSMRFFAGHLLVTQTLEGHRKLEYLLYNLRSITAARARGEQPTTRGVDLLAAPAVEPGKR